MKSELPFRHEDDVNSFNKVHPLTRFLIPFLLVIPCLLINDLSLIYSTLLIVTILNLVFRLKVFETISRLKLLIPFTLILTIFIPFYYGSSEIIYFDFIVPIRIYLEGINLALLIFFRIILAAYTFLSFFSSLTYSEYIESLSKIQIIPSMFIGSIVIMLHYIPILARSNKKVLEAQELRGKNITKYWERLKTHAYIMGKNIVDNMDRSERLYDSLKMRGFTGKIALGSRKIILLDVVVIILLIILMTIQIFYIDFVSIIVGALRLVG